MRKYRQNNKFEIRGTFGCIILNVLCANSVINLKFIFSVAKWFTYKLSNKLSVSVNEGVFVVSVRLFSKYQERTLLSGVKCVGLVDFAGFSTEMLCGFTEFSC